MACLSRRNLIGAAGAFAGGAVLGATAATAAPVDPLLALIAEERRLRDAGCALQDRAIIIARGLVPAEGRRDPAALPASAPYQMEGDALVDQAQELYDQITCTVPLSLAGVIALLELADHYSDPLLERALEGLRALAQRGAA